jgi:pSer/pThr/pTyr-binding forkhead associated (FHA) protein
MAKVRVMKGDEVLLGFVLGDRPITLGRGHESDIHVPDKRLSRRHCTLELKDGRVVVTDLDSTNGVYFKGERVKNATLDVGDEFLMGDVKVSLEVEKLKLGTTEFNVLGEADTISMEDADETGVFRPALSEESPSAPRSVPHNLNEYARRLDQASEELAKVYDDLGRTLGREPRYAQIMRRLRDVTIELEALTGD